MNMKTEEKLIEEGVHVLYDELGAAKTIKFFQLVGVPRGDTLKEIETITEKFSREEALALVKKAGQEPA
jgi:hypothetical protein